MSPFFSIIIPVFNGAKVLSRSIDSILAQSFQNLEIIAVDDGSIDDSLLLLRRYENRDSRIKVLHKKNGGVSSARNLGIKIAVGKYLLFCDVDDEYSIDTLQNVYDYLQVVGEVDVISIPTFIFFSSPQQFLRNLEYYCLYGEQVQKQFFKKCFRYEVWNYIFKKDLVEDIEFPCELSVGEDVIFVVKAIEKASSLLISDKGLYRQYLNSSSVMQQLGENEERVVTDIKLLCYVSNQHFAIQSVIAITFPIIYKYCFQRTKKNLVTKELKYVLKKTIERVNLYLIFTSHLCWKNKIKYLISFFIIKSY